MAREIATLPRGTKFAAWVWVRALETINALLNGAKNTRGTVTLTANATTTTITDARVHTDSHLDLSPTTANAATAVATTYWTAGSGSFTINHANNAQTNRTFTYDFSN